ncbi:MAG: hypothetical protein RL076_2162 [Chloroflexota bacterium]|jgi:hypothetical protein
MYACRLWNTPHSRNEMMRANGIRPYAVACAVIRANGIRPYAVACAVIRANVIRPYDGEDYGRYGIKNTSAHTAEWIKNPA